jgi:hypothetical protein
VRITNLLPAKKSQSGKSPRLMKAFSADYTIQEYGLTAKEMEAGEKRINAEIKVARARGELTPFKDREADFY